MTEHEQLISPSLEKYNYNSFRQTFTCFRRPQVGTKLDDLTKIELPNNSVLHLISHLLTPNTDDIFPDLTFPPLTNEHFQIYMSNYADIPGKTDVQFPVTDTYRFNRGRYQAQFNNFFTAHKQLHRMTSVKNTLAITNALSVFNYDPLLKMMITGRMADYRKFDIIFRSILHNICQIEGKHQYIHIPLSETIYTKNVFQRAFQKIDITTVGKYHDMSFFFLIHLMGLFIEDDETSILKKLTQQQRDTLNIIMTVGNQATVYNIGDVLSLSKDNTFWLLVLKHVNRLKLSADHSVDILTNASDDEIDKLVEQKEQKQDVIVEDKTVADIKVDSVEPALQILPEVKNTPVVQQKKQTVVVKEAPSKDIITHIDDETSKVVERILVEKPHEKEKLVSLAERYKTVEIGGKTIKNLLSSTQPSIEENKLTYLKEQLPDQSMMSSSIYSLDQLYIETMMSKDIASVLSSFNTNGLFLIDCEEHDEITLLDRVRYYKATFQDTNGRKHKIMFKLPIVDQHGIMLSGGISSRMVKQQVNLPICKISDTRVSLASNYNKTLVERVTTKAHSFDVYLNKYLSDISLQHPNFKVIYGHLNSEQKLPYDYSCVANRYNSLQFNDYYILFDYPNRLRRLVANETYHEAHSTLSSYDKLYSITTLLKDTASLPIQTFKVNDLIWILKDAQLTDEDESRINNVDLSAPILVTELKNHKLLVVDGFHRLVKAYREGKSSIRGKYVTQDLLNQHILSDLDDSVGSLRVLENTYGTYCGLFQDQKLFYDDDNFINFVAQDNSLVKSERLLNILLKEFPDVELKRLPSEWTELKIQDKNFPLIFILGFRFGLDAVLKKVGLLYRFVHKGTRDQTLPTELVVPFRDGVLKFDRYPLEKSFIISGLLKFDLRSYTLSDLNVPDTYYTILSDSGLSMNYLRGITNFFDFFVDPITRDVLIHMHEPTTAELLLYRANEMLITQEHIPASSMANHRIRGYERFNSILYNEISRSLASYQNQKGTKKPFSINPQAVFQRIIQDQTVQLVEDINPIHDIKENNQCSYTGQGGRTAQSFVVEDRVYPDDAVGILSECTPDSGKVALTTYTTADPIITNVRGMFNTEKQILEPTQLLSITTLLMPFVTHDDCSV